MTELRATFGDFPEAIRFFRRKLNIPTARWDDLMHGQHAHGFMVAGAARVDLLDDLRRAVDAAIADGETLEQFRKRFDAIIARTGWQYKGGRGWRTRVIWETNVRTAIMAGKWAQFTSPDASRLPYLQYQHNTILNPREQHQAWDGLVIRKDSPWWRTHYPPNGWGCKCTVIQISERQLRRMGKSGPDTPPESDPEGALPEEWAYNVGEAAQSAGAAETLGRKVMTLPEPWRDRVLEDYPSRAADWFRDFAPWFDAAAADRFKPRGLGQAAGVLSKAAVDRLTLAGVTVQSALVQISDFDVSHMLRDAKTARKQAVDLAILRELPQILAAPDAVVYDKVNGSVLYMRKLPPDRVVVIAVVQQPNLKKVPLRGVPTNWVKTATEADVATYKGGGQFEVISGSL